MAINFPNSPSAGDPHSEAGINWIYDGEKWVAQSETTFWSRAGSTLSPSTAGDDVDLGTGDLSAAAGTFSGQLLVSRDNNNTGRERVARFQSFKVSGSENTRLNVEIDNGVSPYVLLQGEGFQATSLATTNDFLIGGTIPASPNITLNADGGTRYDGGPNTQHSWATNNATRFLINDNGSYLTQCNTTANGANAHVWTGSSPSNLLMRSTSSMRYKTDVEPIDIAYSKKVLDIQPIWFRSLSENDPADYSYWGFSAEEVAAVDPRLAFYTPDPDNEQKEIPDGVQYDRFVPHLLNLLKEQNTRIEALEAEVQSLKGGSN